MTDSNYEKGLELFREIYGPELASGIQRQIETGGAFGVEQSRWTLDFTFGAVWTRPGLERKLRSCVALGMLIALRQHDEIKYHTKMGMKNGLSRTELEEIFYTAMPYAGFPAAQSAKQAMLEAFAEMAA
ncbi:carboxymuconolactone decarboxylase family protein [Acidocella sp.]|uniref:carboxymuconolactone decarboxylase family protein n=1 Tax=Acidocella sp. TaxID=50710 RepID=UPI0026255CFD|nr:carboxymuconolactone decarboxylase family protein [Acidocella sp.]